MTLVDTSAWVAFLQADGSSADRTLARLLAEREPIHTTDMVIAELLAGAESEENARRIVQLLASLRRCAPLGPMDIEHAALLFRTARDTGETDASLTACLIAVTALRDDLAVLAADPAFQTLSRHGGPRLCAASPPTPEASAPAPSPPPPPSNLSDPSTHGPARPAGATILVVEDEPSAARILQDALERPDRQIVVATTAKEARVAIRDSAPDVIVLDLILPDEDGRRLLADLRRDATAGNTGVVVVTGKAGPRTREECFGLGADSFFDKPFDAKALADAVEHLVVEGRSEAPQPDPLGGPLPLREVQKLLSSPPSDGNSQAPWTVALLELDTDPEGHGQPAEAPSSGLAGSTPLLPHLLRTLITGLERELESEEVIARWGVDEVVVVSDRKGDDEMQALLHRMSELPELRPYLTSQVRLVGRDEDLLDAVSAMASGMRRQESLARSEAAAPMTVSPQSAATAPAGRPRATLVEDDPVTAGLVRHRLERSGFSVEHHVDGAEALAAILQRPPNVAILDVQLPSMDGFEILSRVKEDPGAKSVPVLMFTSLGRQEHVQRGFELGADDYVTKPFSPSELLTRVLRLVRRR